MTQIMSNKDMKLLWISNKALEQFQVLIWHDLSYLKWKKKTLAQENNLVRLFGEMTNSSAFSE